MTLRRFLFTVTAFVALSGLAQGPAQGETVIVQPTNPPPAGDTVIVQPGNPAPSHGGTVIVQPGSSRAVVLRPGDPALADGCWAEIFEDNDFDQKDAHVILKGPFEAASLKDLAGRNWSKDIESLIMGPRATMYAYKDRDFKDTEVVFAPNQRVKELSEVKLANKIESLRIMCQ